MIRRKINGIIILGGDLVKDKNGWRTTRFSDQGESTKALGDYWRVLAGFYLYKEQAERNTDFFVLVSGGRGQIGNIQGAPIIADVLEKELARMGIPRKKIYKERKSNSTYQQLKIITKLVSKNKWEKIGIVSNSYHLPRIKAFMEYLVDLRLLKAKAVLISAEKILLAADKKKWDGIINRAYKSEWMKGRLILEKQGIKKLKSGFYKLR